MAEFTPKARGLIVETVRQVRGQNPAFAQRFWQGGGDWPQWFALAENLTPGSGGPVDAHPLLWDKMGSGGDGEYLVDEETTVKIRDTVAMFWGLKREWVLCRPLGSDTGWVRELVSSGAPWYEGTLQAQLDYNSTAACHVTIDGETVDLTVTDRFLASGEHLDNGTRVGVTPDVENGRWVVTEAPCPAA